MNPRRLFTNLAYVLILATGAQAQNQCRFYLANHSDGNSGLILSLETGADSSGKCSLGSVSLRLAAGDGTALHHVDAAFSWQTGVVYTAKAVFTAAGSQQLSINGQPAGSAQGAFKPAQGTFFGSLISDSGTAAEAYIVTQISLQVSNGSNSLSLAPNGNSPIPTPLILLAGGAAPWTASFTEDPNQPTIIAATFRFDPAVPDPHQFDPYIDVYGQAVSADWPSKISSDSDLQAAATQEQAWLANNAPLGGLDPYGGSIVAGWTDQATGYYHTAFHKNRWYLISPLGNPLFYLGITAIPFYTTPITGRESMFQLPPQTGTFADAYSLNANNDPQNTTYFSFGVSNQIRKYGTSSKDVKNEHLQQRLSSWAFAGGGKFGNFPQNMPYTPILAHGGAGGVPNAVPGGHPDVFDPSVVSKLKASLASEMGPNITNPYVVGWSVGNEEDEIIAAPEVQAILELSASSAAKKAFVDRALSAIYGGSVSALAAAWKITASTAADVYASKPNPPAKDLETLRRFYETSYYATLYQTVKAVDPNHLYFGSWIPAGNATDWPIAAANCDVVGFDDFSPGPLDANLQALFASTGKPVMLGAWGVPSDYGGTRGFGWNQYTQAMTLSDSASGDAYSQRLASTAANPYMVGAMLFDYSDEPLTGRGNSAGVGNISNSLVIDEDFAFGLVDGTDTPKYDLVNKVRASNIAALQSLGLLGAGCSYVLNAGGEGFPAQGGTGGVTITTGPSCFWTVSGLPPSIQLTSAGSGFGPGTVTFRITPDAGGGSSASFNIAGQTFTIEQEAAMIPGLAAAGSLGQVASEGGWDFSLIGVNLGTSAATARFSFADNTGNPLMLPLTFPQLPPAVGPELASTLDRTLNPNAQVVMESTGPDSVAPLAGSGQLLSTGSVSGFGIFSNPKVHWNAVVPLETRNANKYILAFDNTGALTTSLAIANLAALQQNVQVTLRDDKGNQIGNPTISLGAQGHTSFMLNDPNLGYPATAGKRGTIEFDTPPGGQIGVLGLRVNGAALTTLPVLANVGTTGGSITHVAYNGGWTSVFYIVNTGSASAQFTLSFADENGVALAVPLLLPQSSTNTTTSSLTRTLAAGEMLVVDTNQQDSPTPIVGSAQLTTTGNISGFEIFRWNTFGQEASVPLETRTPNSFVLVFDDTGGLTTGVALASNFGLQVNVSATFRDDTGAQIGVPQTITVPAHGHKSFLLPDLLQAAAGKRGMVEFAAPQGQNFSVIGLRARSSDGTLTTIPVLTK